MNVPLEEVHRRQKLFCDTFLNYFLCKRRKYQNILIENGINLASGHSDFSINFKTGLNEEIDLILENGTVTKQRLLKRSSFSIRHIFSTIYHIIRRTKAVKIIRHMNHVQEIEIQRTIEEVAHEISIAYEYQLVALADDGIVTLAFYGVMCILTYLRGSTAEFTSGKLLQAMLEVKPENFGFEEELKTRPINHQDLTFCWKWKLSGILKQPGLCIRTKSSSAISSSLDLEETVIIRDHFNEESPLKSARDKGGEIMPNNLNNKYNTEVICTNNSHGPGCPDEKLLASTTDVNINVYTEYDNLPMVQEFLEQGICTDDKSFKGKTDGLKVDSFSSSPSEIVHGNRDNDSTKYCRPQHACNGAIGDSGQVEYVKGDNSCLALPKEDNTNVRYILVQECAHTNNSSQHCDSDLAIKSGQIPTKRHTYSNSGFEPYDEIIEEKGLEDRSKCITNTLHCNQFGIKCLDVTCGKLDGNCENSLLDMSSLSEQKQDFSEKCPFESQSCSGTDSQITSLHCCSGKPSDIYCHPVQDYSKIYTHVLDDQCQRYSKAVENQLEVYASAFENQSRSSTCLSLDCIRCENTQLVPCFKAVKSKQNNQLEFYGCFTPWGFRCQPHIYGFRGPLHVMDEETGKYKMIYNDLVSTEPSHGRRITYDPNNPHQAYVPKTFCEH
ncbi:hypothetical protein CHS0354_028980 [Potamilus streckersoni]|uniref:Uncharacterized protein n=1 Tax=Potamilus streckersoni TaxID=2493646 RepID=A0AAE0W8S8_9BIVA|nr:hypothetical protein CHS0354_028980 [Potamilus streckersoni]